MVSYSEGWFLVDSGNLLCPKRAVVLLHRLNCRSFSIYCWHCKLAKCWSDRGRVTIFPQSMLSSPAISPSSAVMLETKSSYLFFPRNARHNVFLLYALVPIIKTIAGWNWSRENNVEEIYYSLNTCWGIFFKQGFPFVLFFQMWPLVLLAPLGAGIFTLWNVYIICALLWSNTKKAKRNVL